MVLTTTCAGSYNKLLKESGLTPTGGSSQKDNKTLSDKGGQTKVCCGLECFQQKKGDANKEKKVVGGEGVAATSRSNTIKDEPSKGQQDSHLTLKNQSVHFLPTLSANKTDRADSPGSHQQNYQAQSNTDGTPGFPILMDFQYDNILDVEEPLMLTTKLEQYDDISEDENHFSRKQAGMMGYTPPVLSEASSKTVENMQGETLIQSGFHEELIPNNKTTPKLDTFDDTEIHSCQCSVETTNDLEHHLCPKGGERRNHLYDPCSVLNDEVDNQSDEQGEESENDDWEVIPVSILDLKFEPASEDVVQGDCEYGQKVHQGDLSARQSFALKPVPASAFSKIAVFDTPDDQEQAIRFGQLSFVVPSCGSPKGKPQMDRKELGSESEDSCDTDNSSTYSSGPECNYMTAPKELFKSFYIPVPRMTDHCVPDKVDPQTPPGLEKVQNISPDDCIISLLDSDEEFDTHFETKRKKRLSQTPENLVLPGYKQLLASLESEDSESEECVLVEDEVSKQNDKNVIILSDSDDEGRENYKQAKNIVTADSVECGRAGSLRQSRNTATPEEPPPVLRPGSVGLSEPQHMSKPEHHKQKISMPRVSSQQSDSPLIEDLTKQSEVVSLEAEGGVFPNDAANVLVPQRKKWEMAPSNLKLSLKADNTVTSTVIPRMYVNESTSDERLTLVSESRHPRQDPCETMSMVKSSPVTSTNIPLKEKLQLFMRDRSVSIPNATNETQRSSFRRMMHASTSQYQRSYSTDSPSTLDHPFTPTKLPSVLAPVQSMQGTSHARNKVFSDWQRQHVPLRREKKTKNGTKGSRRPL
ncbi:uncharacterized protein LOC124883204 isoform X2 [Girardinichthys multiradiatus]|nr:uncharacterized protein LOC124883204 isoform X2 [Girardinichthys multiradiatus]